jgi:hypothetical protein
MKAAAWPFAACLAVLATTALADIAPEIAKSIDICARPGPSMAARIEALSAQGWQPATAETMAETALALAPHDLVMRQAYGISSWDPSEARDSLVRAAETLAERSLRLLDSEPVFLNGSGGVLKLAETDRFGTIELTCLLALPDLTPSDLAAATGVSLDETSRPPVHLHAAFREDPDLPRSVDMLALDPGAFGDHLASPVVVIVSLVNRP